MPTRTFHFCFKAYIQATYINSATSNPGRYLMLPKSVRKNFSDNNQDPCSFLKHPLNGFWLKYQKVPLSHHATRILANFCQSDYNNIGLGNYNCNVSRFYWCQDGWTDIDPKAHPRINRKQTLQNIVSKSSH